VSARPMKAVRHLGPSHDFLSNVFIVGAQVTHSFTGLYDWRIL